MKEHTKPVHIEKRSLSVIMLILKKVKCENIMNLFIQKIGHIIAQIVSLDLPEWTFWKDMSIIFLRI